MKLAEEAVMANLSVFQEASIFLKTAKKAKALFSQCFFVDQIKLLRKAISTYQHTCFAIVRKIPIRFA